LLSSGAKFNEVGSPAGISSLQYLTDLIKDGSMSKEVINWTQNDLEKQFVTNKAAMITDGPWIIDTVKKDAPNLKWGVVKIPKDKVFASDLGGENWGVIKGHHEDAAWEFIKFTQQKDIMNEYCADFGYIPSRKDIAESNDKITKDPIMSVFLDELQYAMPRGPHAKWPEISDAMSTALQESFTNAKAPDQAAKDAQVKIDTVLK
jgi:multiple sugar transport system substrate-binding protein